MIEQQLYTRSSNGYFLNKPGYDTVRLSKGLDLSIAQENNKIFMYKGNDIKNVGENIPVISRFKLDNGDVMLNCSNPYSYMSYDGIKETFISHSYIMKATDEELEQQAKDVRQIAGITDFISTHIDGSNEPLEQLTELPFEKSFPPIDYVKFALKNISGSFFSKVVYTVVNSALTGKRVYLIPESITQIQDILDFLKAVYYFVPICLRNKIGYITSLNEQEVPKGVNIVFVSPTYKTEIESKKLFGYYIADDFCFDLRHEEIIFDGDIDFSKETEFMKLIQNEYSRIAKIEEIISYFDEQLENNVTQERIEILSKFVNALDKKDVVLHEAVEIYESIHLAFKNDFSLPYLENTVSDLVEKANNNISCDEIDDIAILYKYVDEEYQDELINYIINSIDYSANDSEAFYSKLDVCGKYSEIRGYVISRFIASGNEVFITNYYSREFSKYNSVKELFDKLSEYENNSMLVDDGLFSNDSFTATVLNKIDSLAKADFGLSFINKLNSLTYSVKNEKLRACIADKVKKYIAEFTNKNDVYSIRINDLQAMTRNYSDYIDGAFINSAKMILNCFDYVGDDLYAGKINDYFNDANDKIIPLSNYFKKHFSDGIIDRHYFAYTIAYFDPYSKSVELKAAFGNLKSVYEIVHYTKWLVKKFDYFGKNNCLSSFSGKNSPEEKYRDLANTILSSLANVDDDVTKEANSYMNELREYMTPKFESEQDMYSAFCKLVKKAMSGKRVERIEYIRLSEKNKKGKKSAKSSNSKKSANNKLDKGRFYIIIGVACVAIAAIAIGTAFGISHLKNDGTADDKLESTKTSVSKIVSKKESKGTTQNNKILINDIEDEDVLSAVNVALESLNEESLDKIANKDEFIQAFNKELFDTGIIKGDNDFDFKSISKRFDDVYNNYSNNFIKKVNINTTARNVIEIYGKALKNYGIDSIDELSSNDDKLKFVTVIEKELREYVHDLPEISDDFNTYYALEILSDLYENNKMLNN